MTSPLAWCEAERGCQCARNHRVDLQNFTCVEPPPRGVLPKHRNVVGSKWARQVQTGVRSIRPPAPATDLLLLGYDDEGLAVVSHTFEIERGFVKILAAARALRCRGLGYGDLLMEETFRRIAGRFDTDPEGDHILIQGLVHRENGLSQAMVERHQFFYYGDDGELQEWYVRIELADEE